MADLRGLRRPFDGRTVFVVSELVHKNGEPLEIDAAVGPEVKLRVELATFDGVNEHLPPQRNPCLWSPDEGRASYPRAERDAIVFAASASDQVYRDGDRRYYVVVADPMFPKGPAGQALPTRLRPASVRGVDAETSAGWPVDVIEAQRKGSGQREQPEVSGADLGERDAPEPSL